MQVSAADHVTGRVDAPIVVVEYGDFECPRCKQAAPALKALLARNAGKVRFAFRNFPLDGVHPHAVQAAEAAEIAAAQGRFWAMHDLLFENQLRLRRKDLRDYAVQLDLDMRRYDREIREHARLPRVWKQIADAERSGVRSAPGIFLNGRIHDVSFSIRSVFDATADLLVTR